MHDVRASFEKSDGQELMKALSQLEATNYEIGHFDGKKEGVPDSLLRSREAWREAFLEWATKQGMNCDPAYLNSNTHWAREAFQAAWQARQGDELKPFDAISVDVSTGDHDANLRAFANWPPFEIMNNGGEKVALFDGYLNMDLPPDPRLKIATDALQKIASTESAGAIKYIVESAAMRIEAELALSQIQQQEGNR